MVTIKDVARVAGVSTATVSRVVHNRGKVGAACRARVQKVIEDLGYRPNINARTLASKVSDTVGLVTPQLSMTFFGCLAAGVEKAAREKNYKLLMSNSLYETKTEIEAIDRLREHSCAAIILHSEYSDEKTLKDLVRKVPGLVIINRFIADLANRCVWLDNHGGAKKIASHLLDCGHQNIAVVTSVYQNSDPQIRLNAVREAMESRGFALNPEAVVEATANIRGGEEAAKALLKRGVTFSAVIAYNDLMAVGVLNTLQDAGLEVPADVSVVGFDNLYVSSACRPQLTTMDYPVEEMAKYAANLAIDLSSGDSNLSSQTHLFMPSLVERKSVTKQE